MRTPAEAARLFFQGAMTVWVSAPTFKGIDSSMSLNEWFDASLREHLPVISRKRGSDAYINALGSKIEEAYEHYMKGEEERGRESMVDLLNLIHTHLHLPSKRQLTELVANGKEGR